MQARDLRNIDVAYPAHMASILVRDKALIVHVATIRAIVQWDKILLFHTEFDADEAFITLLREQITVSSIPLHLQVSSQMLPFEFRALEAILIYACDFFDKQVSSLQPAIDAEIRALQDNPEHQLENLELYHYKKQLARCEVATQEVAEVIGDILRNDEDMAAMYLTLKAITGYPRRKNQHEEIELLLENYLRQIEQLQGLIKELRESISVTEDYVNIQLDSKRNRMMRYNLILTIGTMSTAIGGMLTGALGMNLHTGLEDNPYAFIAVSGLVVAIATGVFFSLRKAFGILSLSPHRHQVFRASRHYRLSRPHGPSDCSSTPNSTEQR